MDFIKFVIAHYQDIWAQILIIVIAFGGLLKGIEGLIGFIAPFTPWKWDDDIAVALGKFLSNKIFNKK